MEDLETNNITLTDFPDEILLNIFVNLNDTSLLYAARVCHRFKSIAKEAFAKLYNSSTKNKYFQLNICYENLMEERRQYEPFFTTFGNNIGGISINFKPLSPPLSTVEKVPKHHWLIMVIQRHCTSITSIIIENGEKIDLGNIICFTPKLTHLRLKRLELRNDNWTNNHYPKLVYFSADHVKGMSFNAFANFITHNRRNLEKICIDESLDQMNNIIYQLSDTSIKSVKMSNDTLEEGSFMEKTVVALNIENLKKLSIETNNDSFVPLLNTIQGSNIEVLTIQNSTNHYENDRSVMWMQHVRLVCGFDKLTELNLYAFYVSLDELKVLVQSIPTLDRLAFECVKNFGDNQEDFLTIASVCCKLSHIEIFKDFNDDLPILTYEFCDQFACQIGDKSNLKLEFWSLPYVITMTREEVRLSEEVDGETEYHRIDFWKGYDPALSSTGKNLLELDGKVLLDIMGFLNGNDLSALIRTCRLAHDLVKQHLSQNKLLLTMNPMKEIHESSIATLGEHIFRIRIDDDDITTTTTEPKKKKLMEDVAKYCGRELIEFETSTDLHLSEIDIEVRWPNLQKLRFSSTTAVNNRTLKLFHCPKLTQLEINVYGKNEINFGVDWDDSFRNVTSLKFGFYNKAVEKFLNGINQRIGNQLKSLSLMAMSEWFRLNTSRCWINLNIMLSRFRRLENLHLHLMGIEDSNYKFLFENCTRLVELSVFFFDNEYGYDKVMAVFRSVKTNCKNIETVNLVGRPAVYEPSFPRRLYSLVQKVKVNLVDVGENSF